MSPPLTTSITSSLLPPSELLALSSFFASQERLILLEKRSSLQSISSSSSASSDESTLPSNKRAICGMKRKRSDLEDSDDEGGCDGEPIVNEGHEGEEVVLIGGMKMLEADEVLQKVLNPTSVPSSPQPQQLQHQHLSSGGFHSPGFSLSIDKQMLAMERGALEKGMELCQ
ncbi:hypothetical protein BT69DRAFT_1321691 [Atractiella rhizophila]|nr:hypothetical protein BT69DRAFT_1359060 [Atractiella rhizophila]KAH8919843.1 hypothetical protein BT69DRAFT_1352815 [Atractiella rhizophila]KAH8920153.1 hypothetical protein BT69DRAFT_1321691 [Atractiella rhizophila]